MKKTETEVGIHPNAEAISALRRLADLLEKNPGLPKLSWFVSSAYVQLDDVITPAEVATVLGPGVTSGPSTLYYELHKSFALGMGFSVKFPSSVCGVRTVVSDLTDSVMTTVRTAPEGCPPFEEII